MTYTNENSDWRFKIFILFEAFGKKVFSKKKISLLLPASLCTFLSTALNIFNRIYL
jgi:hypothetical protein